MLSLSPVCGLYDRLLLCSWVRVFVLFLIS